MLLAQLQEIIDIDTRISEIHRELAKLYAIRSSIMGVPAGSSSTIQNVEVASPNLNRNNLRVQPESSAI